MLNVVSLHMKEEKIPSLVTGRVKWFNQFKGYGFIEVENISEDIFLHFSVIDKSEIDRLNNEDVILCNIVKSEKGYQVSDIVRLLHSNKYEIGEQKTVRVVAVMKWFNPSKGFGFAQLSSGEDVFIHSSILKKHKISSIEPGQQVKLLIHSTNFGYEAIDIII
jgi:CspA family cold shock protein